MSVYVCLSVFLFVLLWLPSHLLVVSVSVYLPVCLLVSFSMEPCLRTHVHVSLSVCIRLQFYLYNYVCMSACLPLCHCLSACSSVRVSVCLSDYIYICLPGFLSLCLSACLYVCLYVQFCNSDCVRIQCFDPGVTSFERSQRRNKIRPRIFWSRSQTAVRTSAHARPRSQTGRDLARFIGAETLNALERWRA